MNFLKPAELRDTLRISRSTEHRLLRSGMPSIGVGRLRRYDQEAAVEWFRTHAHETTTSRAALTPGLYQCPGCGFQGHIQKPMVPGPCRCGSKATPVRITAPQHY